jgi:hypothetical protein
MRSSSKNSSWTPAMLEALKTLRGEHGLSFVECADALNKSFPGVALTVTAIQAACGRLAIRKPTPTQKEPITVKTVARASREAALEGKITTLLQENTILKKKCGELQEIRKLIVSECQSLGHSVVPSRYVNSRIKPGEFPAVLLLGDWHIGEKIANEESGGWGDYNYKVACTRVEVLCHKFLSWIKTARHGMKVSDLIVLGVGDFVSGNIHKDLEVSNEWPAPLAAVRAGDLLGSLLQKMSHYFSRVCLHFVGVDNHGRLAIKPETKQAAINNWNVVVAAVAEGRTALQKNVKVVYHTPNPTLLDLGGKKVLVMHGSQIRGWAGIPAYGMQRFRGRKAVVHMLKGEPFDLIICGHWHEPTMPPGWMVNGCLCGTTELDHEQGRMAPPSQTSFLWSSKHGAFNITNWNLA